MKKILLSLLLLTGVSLVASAVPARPGKFKRTLPDGSTIVLENHGDEYFHWLTDEAGRIVEKGANGYYHTVDGTAFAARRARSLAERRKATWSSYENPPETNFGDRKILCILANFSDSTYVIDNPQEKFSDMLNQAGYAYDGAIGSVRDYFMDNSRDQYHPRFDVYYCPVALSQSSAYYDKKGPQLAIREAFDSLSKYTAINFDDYDTDNDGDIDMVLFYYPGHNEAEGAGEESIWPHRSTGNYGTLGGKTFNQYFCTSELRNTDGNDMCAIGTTCHEFAHALGLPDFYDTDYETNGQNTMTTGNYDLMSGGNYNDQGRRPPYLNSIERNMLGWMENFPQLEAGNHTLAPVYENDALRCDTDTEGEYFVLECRDRYKWDSAIPGAGLLVYHIDKSGNTVPGSSYTGAQIWNTNKINAYGGHPCCCLYPSERTFPGSDGGTTLLLKDWNDQAVGILLSGITEGSGGVSFSVVSTSERVMFGTVRNGGGQAVAGARVVVRKSAYPFAAAPALMSGDIVVVSDETGFYSITLPETSSNEQILVVSMEGYVPVCLNVAAAGLFTQQDIYLPRLGEGDHSSIQRYDPSLTFYYTRFSGASSIGMTIHYSAEEIAEMGLTGGQLETVSFQTAPTTYEQVYLVVDVGGQRALLREVTDRFSPGAYVSYPVSDAGITLTEGADLYVGYGLTGLNPEEYGISMYGPQSAFTDGTYINRNFLTSSSWTKTFAKTQFFSFIIAAEVSARRQIGLNDFGVAFIRLNADVPTVVAPAGKTVYSTEWFLDGTAVEVPAALSSHAAGDHTYMVRLTYYDGTVERVYYDFTI